MTTTLFNTENRKSLLQSCLATPQKYALSYFSAYFNSASFAENGVIHPQAGNLILFLHDLDKNWDNENKGLNLVAELIRSNIRSFTSNDVQMLDCSLQMV